MEYSLRDGAEGYLTVALSGMPSKGRILEMLEEVLARLPGSRLRGILVEVRVAAGLDLVSTKELVAQLPAMGFPPRFRFAVLLLDDAARQAAHFAEDVAVNRGIGVRVFERRDAAVEWLSS